jgi:phosphoserine phosphatase RsbU/P
VTVFYAILHTGTGLVEYCLGGHNPPYRISTAGALTPIEEPGGVVVGLLPESTYETGSLQLAPGEAIFLFTDGVTEAMDPEQHFYTERRLKQVLAGCGGLEAKDTVGRVLGALGEFTAGAPQSDDITTMAVRWNGAK